MQKQLHPIEVYANNRPMLEQYIKINNITHFRVFKSDRYWLVYQMWTDTIGCNQAAFDRKYLAVEYAKKLAEICQLPFKTA